MDEAKKRYYRERLAAAQKRRQAVAPTLADAEIDPNAAPFAGEIDDAAVVDATPSAYSDSGTAETVRITRERAMAAIEPRFSEPGPALVRMGESAEAADTAPTPGVFLSNSAIGKIVKREMAETLARARRAFEAWNIEAQAKLANRHRPKREMKTVLSPEAVVYAAGLPADVSETEKKLALEAAFRLRDPEDLAFLFQRIREEAFAEAETKAVLDQVKYAKANPWAAFEAVVGRRPAALKTA